MPEVEQPQEVKVERVEEMSVEGKSEEPEDEWVDILGSGDLKKKIIKAGIVESRPSKGCTVVVRASGRLEDGTQVDTHDQLTFTVGDSEVILGLDMILPLMDKGEISDVYMGPRFAYGSDGMPPSIPGESNITYRVELLDYALEQSPESLPLDERMEIGNRKRERGNWWFNRTEYAKAIQCYSAAVDFFDDAEAEYGEEIRPEVHTILGERLKALNNMAAAQMKIEAYDVALKSLESVLRCQPDNVKALFRKGKVLGMQGKMKDSITFLKKALELEPESRLIHQELAKMREKARIEAESEKSLYRRMLGLKNEVAQTNERYPVIRGFPWKSWLISFITISFALVAYTKGPMIYKFFL